MKKIILLSITLGLLLVILTSCGIFGNDKCQHNSIEETGGYDSTCTQTGLTDIKACRDCGEVFSEQHVILKSMHSFENDYTCTVCGTTVSPSQGFEYEFLAEENAYTITGIGTCTDKDIYIPFTYNGLPVIAISDSAFQECYFINSITLSNNIRYVGSGAFYNCIGLTRLIIDKNIEEIPYYALLGCGNIREVYNLSDLLFTNDAFDGYAGAFKFCKPHVEAIHKSTTEASILENVGDYQFMVLDNKYHLIGYLGNSTKLDLPTDYRGNDYYIGKYAFSNQVNMTNISIPDNVKGVLMAAFTEAQRSNYTIPLQYNEHESGRYLGNAQNPYLVLIEGTDSNCMISQQTKIIAGGSFVIWNSNEAFVVPDSVTYIGERSLMISNIYLGKSVCEIDEYAFGTEAMTEIGLSKENPHYKLIDGSLYTKDGSTLVKAVDKNDTNDFTIPNGVTTISGYAFCECYIDNLTIPSSVVNVADTAFEECFISSVYFLGSVEGWLNISTNTIYALDELYINGELVTKLVIPEGVTEIPSYAFAKYSHLEELYLPNSLTKINDYAFYNCSSLKSISFTSSLKQVCGWAFSADNYNLDCRNIYFNGTIEDWLSIEFEYGASLFAGENSRLYINGNELKNLVIPKNITEINDFAFNNCASIETITLYSGVSQVGNNAFNCPSKKAVYYYGTIEDWCNIHYKSTVSYADITPISYGADLYINDQKLTSLVLPNNADRAYFRGCTSITEITIPNGITELSLYAFTDCTSLRRVIFGKDICSIPKEAFQNCPNLVEIYNLSDFEITLEDNIAENVLVIHTSTDEPSAIRTKDDFVFAYLSDDEIYLIDYNGEDVNVTLPDSFDGKEYIIHKLAFGGNDRIKSIIISDGVKAINDESFKNCYALNTVRIGNRVTSIGSNMFAYCNRLYSVVIGTGVNEVADYAFYNCKLLYEAYNFSSLLINFNERTIIHTSLSEESILDTENDFIFANSLLIDYAGADTHIILPSSYKGGSYEIGDYAFYDNDNIISVDISHVPSSIGKYAFSECSSLTRVIFNDGTESIGDYAFSNTPLNAVDLPSKLTTLGEGAFGRCTNIKNLTIPSSLTKIERGVFYRCTITSVNYLGALDGLLTLINSTEWYDETPFLRGDIYLNGELQKEIIIPDGTTKIPADLLLGSSIEWLVISNSVTHIGTGAFADCDSLKAVVIPNSAEEIERLAFYDCQNLIVFFEHTSSDDIVIGISTIPTANMYWYSESKPTQDGNYWHYVNGEIVIWE